MTNYSRISCADAHSLITAKEVNIVSQSAAAYMAEKGFEEVYSLDGGYQQWAISFPDDCEKEV